MHHHGDSGVRKCAHTHASRGVETRSTCTCAIKALEGWPWASSCLHCEGDCIGVNFAGKLMCVSGHHSPEALRQ